MTLALVLAVIALAVAIGAIHSQNKRYKALRRRLERQRLASVFDHRMLSYLAGEVARRLPGAPEPRFPLELRSQHGEDMLILALFDGLRDGFYIEAGAYDGYIHSNTYALDALGWRGLLVEPLPDRAEAARRARPHARVVQAALVNPGGPDSVDLQVSIPEGHAHELCSHIKPAGEDPSDQHRAGDSLNNTGVVTVPAFTLDDLLADHEGEIHAAVIDLEGYELPAFDGFDLDRFRPKVLIVEDHAMRDDSDIGAHLHARGYATAGWLSFNRINVRTDEPELLERARFLLHDVDQPGTAPDRRATHAPAATGATA